MQPTPDQEQRQVIGIVISRMLLLRLTSQICKNIISHDMILFNLPLWFTGKFEIELCCLMTSDLSKDTRCHV